jgi:hypothetical protein
MQELLDAPIVDIRRIQDRGRAAAYCAKYCGKQPHKFEGTKRFWRSLDWRVDADADNDADANNTGVWLKVRHGLDWVLATLESEGFSCTVKAHTIFFTTAAPP